MNKIIAIILILILPIVALAANLFSDGFESGDLTAWDGSDTDDGKLSVAEAAKLHGNYGMSVFIDDQTAKYVFDQTPNDETRYRLRFYIDPNGLTMAEDDEFYLFDAVDNTWAVTAFIIFLNYSDSAYNIWVSDRADGAWNKSTAKYVISDAPHCIEFDWKAATGVGQNDGEIILWIDGVLKETISTIDSDLGKVGNVRWGVVANLDAGTEDTFFLDDFDSNNDGSLIGQIGDNAKLFGCNF